MAGSSILRQETAAGLAAQCVSERLATASDAVAIYWSAEERGGTMVKKLEWGLQGVILPLITPFKDDLSVDWDGLRALVDHYVDDVRVRRPRPVRHHGRVADSVASGARRGHPGRHANTRRAGCR